MQERNTKVTAPCPTIVEFLAKNFETGKTAVEQTDQQHIAQVTPMVSHRLQTQTELEAIIAQVRDLAVASRESDWTGMASAIVVAADWRSLDADSDRMSAEAAARERSRLTAECKRSVAQFLVCRQTPEGAPARPECGRLHHEGFLTQIVECCGCMVQWLTFQIL